MLEKSARAHKTCVEPIENEYLPQIGSRQKWYLCNDNLYVGDVVVVIDSRTVRGEWNVRCIKQTYPGPDRLMRVVNIWVNGKTLK